MHKKHGKLSECYVEKASNQNQWHLVVPHGKRHFLMNKISEIPWNWAHTIPFGNQHSHPGPILKICVPCSFHVDSPRLARFIYLYSMFNGVHFIDMIRLPIFMVSLFHLPFDFSKFNRKFRDWGRRLWIEIYQRLILWFTTRVRVNKWFVFPMP